MKGSKVKRSEEVDAANRRTRGKRTALKAIRGIEETRAQNTGGIRQIYIIKCVAGRGAEGQSVTTVGAGAATHLRSRAEQRAARTTAATATTAASRTTLSLVLVAAGTL